MSREIDINSLAGLVAFKETSPGVFAPIRLAADEESGHLLVRTFPGPSTQAHNRELLGVNKPATPLVTVGDLHTATWTKDENITEITVAAVLGAPAAAAANSDLDSGIYICFDATSPALAATWLSEASHESIDSNRYWVRAGTFRTFRFSAPVERADCIAGFNSANNDFDVILEAN